MTHLARYGPRRERILGGLRRVTSFLLGWWNALGPPERVLYRAIGLLAVGCGMVWLPLAFIVPGILFAAVFFGFTFRRS